MPRAIFGVIIECDPSIKAIIVEIDSQRNDIIVEDIDDQHLVVKENMVDFLKAKLDERLKETQNEQNDDGSGSD